MAPDRGSTGGRWRHHPSLLQPDAKSSHGLEAMTASRDKLIASLVPDDGRAWEGRIEEAEARDPGDVEFASPREEIDTPTTSPVRFTIAPATIEPSTYPPRIEADGSRSNAGGTARVGSIHIPCGFPVGELSSPLERRPTHGRSLASGVDPGSRYVHSASCTISNPKGPRFKVAKLSLMEQPGATVSIRARMCSPVAAGSSVTASG